MTGVAVAGLMCRPRARVLQTVGWVSLLLFALYLVNSYLLYFHGQYDLRGQYDPDMASSWRRLRASLRVIRLGKLGLIAFPQHLFHMMPLRTALPDQAVFGLRVHPTLKITL